ncbi:MAG: SDR family oxidoreductase [Pseudomonadota bacterium]
MNTILITGAGRGIGYELAKQAVDRGWNVIGSVRTVEAQRELAQKIPQMAVLNFDVTDFAAIEKITGAFHAPIDILVNCVGIKEQKTGVTIETIDTDDLAHVFHTNVIAPLKLVQTFLPLLKESDFPRIVNISSRLGCSWHASEFIFSYKTTKAALNKLTQLMALDLGKQGITSIAMHPGWVRTDMGGDTADISPKESAFGILNVIAQLQREDNGSFINYDGERWEW